MHLILAIRNRGYTNKVRRLGLTENQGLETHVGGFCLCSRDFQSPGARYELHSWVYLCLAPNPADLEKAIEIATTKYGVKFVF